MTPLCCRSGIQLDSLSSKIGHQVATAHRRTPRPPIALARWAFSRAAPMPPAPPTPGQAQGGGQAQGIGYPQEAAQHTSTSATARASWTLQPTIRTFAPSNLTTGRRPTTRTATASTPHRHAVIAVEATACPRRRRRPHHRRRPPCHPSPAPILPATFPPAGWTAPFTKNTSARCPTPPGTSVQIPTGTATRNRHAVRAVEATACRRRRRRSHRQRRCRRRP